MMYLLIFVIKTFSWHEFWKYAVSIHVLRRFSQNLRNRRFQFAVNYVQNFEANYIDFDKPIAKDNNHITLSGELLTSDEIYGIYVSFDESPTPEIYEEHKDDEWYSFGEVVGGVTTEDYYYDEITTIVADRWSVIGHNIEIEFDLDTVVNERGIYTIEFMLEDKKGQAYSIMNYSLLA